MKNQNVKFIIMAMVAVIVLAMYMSNRSSGPGQYELSDLPAGSRQQTVTSGAESTVDTEAEQEYMRGKELLDSGNVERGREHLERAVELDPAFAKAHNGLGVAYLRQELYEQAIGEYETALELDSGYVEALYNLGNAFQILGRADEAIVCYRNALLLDEQYYRAHNNLGGIYALAGELDSAVIHFEAATKINPDFIDAHRNLANVYAFLGDSTKAAVQSHIVDTLQR